MWDRTTSCPEGAPGDGAKFGWVQGWRSTHLWAQKGPGTTPVLPDRGTTQQTLHGHTGEVQIILPKGPTGDVCEGHVKFMCSSPVRNSLRSPFTISSALWGTDIKSHSVQVLRVCVFPWRVCAHEYQGFLCCSPESGHTGGALTAAGAQTPVLVSSPPHCITKPPWAHQGYRLQQLYPILSLTKTSRISFTL